VNIADSHIMCYGQVRLSESDGDRFGNLAGIEEDDICGCQLALLHDGYCEEFLCYVDLVNSRELGITQDCYWVIWNTPVRREHIETSYRIVSGEQCDSKSTNSVLCTRREMHNPGHAFFGIARRG
jgi:hypothetical protein